MTKIDGSPSIEFRLDDSAVAKDPGPFFEELRGTCPVGRADVHGGFWTLVRYADVHEATLNTQIFSSAAGVTIPPGNYPPSLCLEQDDPEHRVFRRPMNSWFSPARMEALEGEIRKLVSRLLDEVIDDGSCDIGAVLATPVPAVVAGMLLGLPEEDWGWFRDRSETSLRCASNGDLEGAGVASMELAGYLGGKLEHRRADPQEDLLTEIVRMEVGGAPIGVEQGISLAYLLLVAGHETTVGAIGGLLYRVARDHQVRDQLIADPSLIPNAVEEALRLEPPLMGLGRIVTQDTEVAGVPIPAGERALLMFGAANRDPEVFDDPESFRLDRHPNRHLGFGVGIHRCVGAPLARAEMRVVLEEVLRRMPGIRITADAGVTVSYHFTRAFSAIPVVW
jgi:cytochrome P450